MKRWTILALIGGAAVSLVACASILGIEDGQLAGSGIADGGDAEISRCVADGGESPNKNSGIFVFADVGADTGNCGTEELPCKTIGFALATALKTANINTVYVAAGLQPYNETVAPKSGLTIEGGWTVRGTEWLRVCDLTDATQLPNIVGTTAITIDAENINGDATLRYLSIAAKPAVPGETVYGVYAAGTTQITLENVVINMPPGGNGNDGDAGKAGALPAPSCSPGTALTPEAGAPGVGATGPIYAKDGIVVTTGEPGGPGGSGTNGAAGANGDCIDCVTCNVGLNCGASAPQSCGTAGSPGCGGGSGGGGFAGQSGGSSVGIYAFGGAVVVTVNGGAVQAGKGGSGGAGGLGGSGGAGSAGSTGSSGGKCSTSCNLACAGGAATTGMGTGGAAGGKGGDGSNGGAGGAGAGGDSFAIFSGADASISVVNNPKLGAGSGGSSKGAAPGLSADIYP